MNPTTQRNQATDRFVPITSIKSKITSEHPLVKLGFIIFEMSNDLKKTLPKCGEGSKLFTPILNNERSSNGNILGSDDKKKLHHPVDSTPRNKDINDYMDDVCNFVM